MALDINIDFDEKIEQLAKVPKTIRLAVVSAFLVLLVGAYWYFGYQPAQVTKSEFVMRSQELQRSLNNARTVANNVDGFEAEVAVLERDLDLALKQLPNRKQFEDLLQDISTAGKKVGVSIKSIDRNNEVRRDFYAEVPFALEIEGTYHDLARFFEMVAGLPRNREYRRARDQGLGGNAFGHTSESQGKATTFRFLSGEA